MILCFFITLQRLCLKYAAVACRDEEGEYFAVDIGGTNYRVIYVKLSDKKSEVVSAAVSHQFTCRGTQLVMCSIQAFTCRALSKPCACMHGSSTTALPMQRCHSCAARLCRL